MEIELLMGRGNERWIINNDLPLVLSYIYIHITQTPDILTFSSSRREIVNCLFLPPFCKIESTILTKNLRIERKPHPDHLSKQRIKKKKKVQHLLPASPLPEQFTSAHRLGFIGGCAGFNRSYSTFGRLFRRNNGYPDGREGAARGKAEAKDDGHGCEARCEIGNKKDE